MGKRPVEINDLFRIQLVNDPDVCGHRIAFVVTTGHLDDNRYRAAIWQTDLDSGEVARLTSGQHRDTKPRWSPDGTLLAFTSDRDPDERGKNQLWVLPASGGEPRRLTSLDKPIEAFEWSPDGTRIVCVTKVREQAGDDESDVRVIRTIRFRVDGEGFLDGFYRQLFVIDVDSGDARQITSGPFEHRQPAWSPSGYEIAFTSNREEGWELSPESHLYVVRPESGSIRRLTQGRGAWSHPSWSLDSSTVACLGTRELDRSSARNELFILPARGGEPESISEGFDRDLRDGAIADLTSYGGRPPTWLDAGRLAVVYSDRGSVRLATIGLDGDVTSLTGEGRRVGEICALDDGGFVYCGNSAVDPGELYVCEPDGSNERRLTGFNDDWLDEVALATPEEFTVESDDGLEVHGWLMKPVSYQEGARYPLLLQIHGGPYGMYGWTMMHEFQLLAGKGYALVFSNPRGSAGYGDSFTYELEHGWGEKDFPDLMAAVNHVVSSGIIDERRMGVLGGSYGGFMTNWITSHTDRFSAAVTMRSVSDWFSAYGTDDIFFADNETTFGATPWEDPEIYWRLSPISYVGNVQTPTLIIHSEEDYRCPVAQAEEWFTALKRLGVETELVRFPEESHGLSRTGKPKHRAERLEHILRWFDTYL